MGLLAFSPDNNFAVKKIKAFLSFVTFLLQKWAIFVTSTTAIPMLQSLTYD
jgi:hypothetical protein